MLLFSTVLEINDTLTKDGFSIHSIVIITMFLNR